MAREIIKVESVCKSFSNGCTKQQILNHVNLQIYDGDFTIIMGSSGAGKSTLLYMLSSMDKPTSGKIKLLGDEITTCSEKEIANIRSKKISFIFQGINLLPDLTAYENIAFPAYLTMPKEKAHKRAAELLERFGLKEQAEKFPNELSGGQQQRIAIARAVITKPEILFGDEPTGALNSSSGIQVLDLLNELNRAGQSIVMVTHDIKACARGNRLLYLKDGNVSAELELGRYIPEKQKEREAKVFQFLEQHNW